MNISTSTGAARACGIAIASTFAASAHSADEVDKMYVNPQYGYTWLDSSRAVDDGDHPALGIGWHLTDLLSLELNWIETDFDNTIEPYAGDPILGKADKPLQEHVPGAQGQPHARVPGGHFVQEDAGVEIAERTLSWLAESGLLAR